jgi:hypothetical protein
MDPDPKLFGQVGPGTGNNNKDPAFWQENLYNLRQFCFKMVQLVIDYRYSLENL